MLRNTDGHDLLKAHISCMRMGYSYLDLLSQCLLPGHGATENHTRMPENQCFHHSVRLFMLKSEKLDGIKTVQGYVRQERFLYADDKRKTRENVRPLLNEMGDLIMQGVEQG